LEGGRKIGKKGGASEKSHVGGKKNGAKGRTGENGKKGGKMRGEKGRKSLMILWSFEQYETTGERFGKNLEGV